jgi:hypothetical protein
MRKLFVLSTCTAVAVVCVIVLTMSSSPLWEDANPEMVKGGACYTFTFNSCPGENNATCTSTPCSSNDGGATWSCGISSVTKRLTLGFFDKPHSVETGGFTYPARADTQCSSTMTCITCVLNTQNGLRVCADWIEVNDPLTPSCDIGDPC